MPTTIYGLREISAAYAKLERDTRAGMQQTLRDAATPVQRTAEQLGQARITRIGKNWWKMRVGITRSLVYVAPTQRAVRGADNPRKRKNLAKLLMDEAMEPALERNEREVEAHVEKFLERVAADFNH